MSTSPPAVKPQRAAVALCDDCGHPREFHINLNGQPRPCDHEGITPYGLGEEPRLCGCAAFQRSETA